MKQLGISHDEALRVFTDLLEAEDENSTDSQRENKS
jgi:hypothetical protein